MSDPCQCLFDHEAAMQRLISWLRESADTAGDGLSQPPGGVGQNSLVLWSVLWGLIAMGLFLSRPNSMRQRRADPTAPEKPGPSSQDHDNGPPPPGLT